MTTKHHPNTPDPAEPRGREEHGHSAQTIGDIPEDLRALAAMLDRAGQLERAAPRVGLSDRLSNATFAQLIGAAVDPSEVDRLGEGERAAAGSEFELRVFQASVSALPIAKPESVVHQRQRGREPARAARRRRLAPARIGAFAAVLVTVLTAAMWWRAASPAPVQESGLAAVPTEQLHASIQDDLEVLMLAVSDAEPAASVSSSDDSESMSDWLDALAEDGQS